MKMHDTETLQAKTKIYAVQVWLLIGLCILGVFLLNILGHIAPALLCLLVGVLVGFICSSITNFLEDHHIGRAFGSLIALATVLGVVAAVLVFLVPPFFDQLLLLLSHIPSYLDQIQEATRVILDKATHAGAANPTIQANIQNMVSSLSSMGSVLAQEATVKITSWIIPNIMSVISTLFMSFLGLVLGYWFSKDYPKIMREFAVVAGPEHRNGLTLMFAVMSRAMGGYMRGILCTSVIGGLLAFFGFSLIKHPYAGLMGILTGIMHFVPVIGPWCSAALAALVAFFVHPVLALESILVSVIAQNVTDNLVSPIVMQSAVRVHPVLSLLAITIGASLGGALGMALAIPLSAAIKGVFVYYFEQKTGRQLVSYDGALFRSTPYVHSSDDSPVPAFDALDDVDFFERSRLVDKELAPEDPALVRPQDKSLTMAEKLRRIARETSSDTTVGYTTISKDASIKSDDTVDTTK